MTAPIGCLDGEQAIRDALAALPDGWGCAFVESREKEFGIVEIGHPWEDEQGLAEVITVDTANYYDSPAASKIAAFIVAANPKSIAALLAELDRLRSASRQEGWQPIETAPKDGTEVLLWLRAPWSRVEQLCWREEIGGWLVKGIDPKDAEGMCGALVPTHWMRLPAAPNQSQEAQGDSK